MTNRRLKFVIFASTGIVYLGVGWWLQIRHGYIMGDTLSRVASTQAVLFSRDPHLAAKELFGRETEPASLPPQAIGF